MILQHKNQRILECLSIVYGFGFVMVVGAALAIGQPSPYTVALSRGLGFEVTPQHFAAIIFITALGIPFMLTKKFKSLPLRWRITSYAMSGFSILVYTVPLGVYLYSVGGSQLVTSILMFIYFSFVLIPLLLYRK